MLKLQIIADDHGLDSIRMFRDNILIAKHEIHLCYYHHKIEIGNKIISFMKENGKPECIETNMADDESGEWSREWKHFLNEILIDFEE